MVKPTMSAMPGMNAMTDTFEFMKNLWGGMSASGMGIPGMVMPTLSLEDINKQIKDLKAVESWLNVNMNMLRGTIQALEVQSATISTLQSMGETFNAAAKANADSGAAAAASASASAFSYPFSSPPAAAPEPEIEEEPAPEPAPKTAPEAKSHAEPAAAIPPLANPAAWWNMLQDQFQQALNAAISDEPTTPPATSAAAAPSAPAARAPAAPRKRKAPPKKA